MGIARSKIKNTNETNEVNDDLNKIALPKFFKELMLSSKDRTYAARKLLYQICRDLKREINEIMDLLENKHIDVRLLHEKINAIKLSSLNDQVGILGSIYENKYYTLQKDRKEVDIDPVSRHFVRKVRRHTDSRW